LNAGGRLFEDLGCSICHRDEPRIGPSLEGIFGRKEELQSGEVIVDRDYIRRSILMPKAQIVASYKPRMPNYRSQIGEEDLGALVAFVRSLSGPEAESAPEEVH
jgi:cytochrome c oxidase subunit 2